MRLIALMLVLGGCVRVQAPKQVVVRCKVEQPEAMLVGDGEMVLECKWTMERK